ncbi:MAG: hypothetical protein SNJ50_21210, partial [Cyanobacteriota bacterium]
MLKRCEIACFEPLLNNSGSFLIIFIEKFWQSYLILRKLSFLTLLGCLIDANSLVMPLEFIAGGFNRKLPVNLDAL